VCALFHHFADGDVNAESDCCFVEYFGMVDVGFENDFVDYDFGHVGDVSLGLVVDFSLGAENIFAPSDGFEDFGFEKVGSDAGEVEAEGTAACWVGTGTLV
jgi:hypothetical protein